MRRAMREASYRIKKRTFVVLGIATATTFAVAALLAVLSVWLAGPTDVLRIDLAESTRRDRLIGGGADFPSVESANLLVDASFEPLVYREVFTVYEGDSQTLTVAEQRPSLAENPAMRTTANYPDDFFTGASASVLTPGPDGLSLKKTAMIAAYHVHRVGQFQNIQIPADVPEDMQILDFAYREGESLAVGARGLILSNLGTATPMAIASGVDHDLIGVCADSSGYLAVSEGGDMIHSPDGMTWTAWPVLDPRPLRSVAVSDQGLYVAVGNDGLILTGPSARLSEVAAPTPADLIHVVYGSGVFLALDEEGVLWRSVTGIFWEKVSQTGSSETVWRAIDWADGQFAAVGDAGQFAISADGRTFEQMSLGEAGASKNGRDLVMISASQMIVLDQEGAFLFTYDGGRNWSDSTIDTGLVSVRIARISDGQLVAADADGRLGLAPLVSEIRLDQPLVSGNFESGDLIFLEQLTEVLPEGGDANVGLVAGMPGKRISPESGWEVFGPAEPVRSRLFVPQEGGLASLHLSTTENGGTPVILSQVIDPDQFKSTGDSQIFLVELWLRQEGLADPSVKLWLSGDITTIGTTIDHVGTTWKKYTHTLVLPAALARSQGEIRFNISFTGPGDLWVDRIYLGPSGKAAHGLDPAIGLELEQARPNVLRLSFLGLGQANFRSLQWASDPGNDAPARIDGNWTYPSGQSLATGLELAQTSGSDPWLVLDTFMREDELLSLVEYLAGPVSAPYGRLRMNQGQIQPWLERFAHIYLEIGDPENNLDSDFLRAAYVDWLIRTVESSPYFNTIKSQLVFVDGMNYSDGVLRSSADYHASKLTGQFMSPERSGASEAIRQYFDQLPRNPAQTRSGWHELIASARLDPMADQDPQLAHLLDLSLQQLGESVGLINARLSRKGDLTYRPFDAIAVRILAQTQDSVPLDIIAPQSDLKAFAYRTPSEYLVILANGGMHPLTARLTGLVDTRGAHFTSYDATGKILRERQINRSREQLTVLPGGVIVLKKPLDTP